MLLLPSFSTNLYCLFCHYRSSGSVVEVKTLLIKNTNACFNDYFNNFFDTIAYKVDRMMTVETVNTVFS